jgi:hypothetical protein
MQLRGERSKRAKLSHYREWPMSAFPPKPDYVRTIGGCHRSDRTGSENHLAIAERRVKLSPQRDEP